ncbi:Fic family protein [Candidatus Daviesbacteria bacterium]|nr:Fic family protein [Candidatus Daviesbacteria bacterium]
MFKPKLTITPSILDGISLISEIKAIVERSKVLPLNEAQLRRQALVRMAHTSTSIEGNPLAEYQVDKVLAGMSVNADQKSIIEVKNYQQALKEAEQLAKEKSVLTIENVLKLHSLVMKGLLEAKKTGHFRPGSVFIVDDLGDGREKLRFEGPEAKKVPFLVNELLNWLASEKTLHPILKAGIFHSHFVNIHPFSDGNGRMTRLLATLILYKEGWDFRKILVLEDYYNRDRLAYYNGLASSSGTKFSDSVDFTPWLEYFVEGFLYEAKNVADKIESIGFAKTESDTQVFLDRDEVKIMDFLTSTGRITSQDVEDLLKVAKRTAQLKLKKLIEKKLISIAGSGPATYYLLKN